MFRFLSLVLICAASLLSGCALIKATGFIQPVELEDHVWVELYRDDEFIVSLDQAHVEAGPEPDTFAVWYQTDRLELQYEDEEPWNREVIRSLLRCEPLQFKTVRVTVFHDDGPPVAQVGGALADVMESEWRGVVPESVDEASMGAACARIG